MIAYVINLLGLVVAAYFVPGIQLTQDPKSLMLVALIFTLLNFILKPVLKMLLGPFILITLGLALILINMGMLYLLDKLSSNLTIVGVPALLYGALIIGIVNLVFHSATKA